MPSITNKKSTVELSRKNTPAVLLRLMELSGEAVVVFDGKGVVVRANSAAGALISPDHQLEGCLVQDLFWNATNPDFTYKIVQPSASSFTSWHQTEEVLELPFDVDGSLHRCACGYNGKAYSLCDLRCDRASTNQLLYVMVAKRASIMRTGTLNQAQEIQILRKANHRLSGTLKIILDTLNINDVHTLFSQSLEEICNTMDADGSVVYLADRDGFHFQDASKSLKDVNIIPYLPFGRGYEAISVNAQNAVRFHVLDADKSELRVGRLLIRKIYDEDTAETFKIPAYLIPPFKSFISVPVWFGGHVIALFLVGWSSKHQLKRDDARLLDSVAQYLSVQIMGALKTLRAQRIDKLDKLEAQIHERLALVTEVTEEAILLELQCVADEIDAYVVPVAKPEFSDYAIADLPLHGLTDVPFSIDDIDPKYYENEIAVVPIGIKSDVYTWLDELGEPPLGALVDMGEILGTRRVLLVLRSATSEPLEDIELNFLHRLAEIVKEVSVGIVAREQDKRIAQSLQLGMKNVLQKVDGITADGIYSSATADAFVGGDFYDLIRLDNRRACVIMGDVSGKGVEAASISSAVKTALAAYAWTGLTPAHMVRTLNRFLLGFSRIETFATLFVGIVDLETNTITYCSAGHPPAMIYRASTHNIDTLDVQSGVVGAFEEMLYNDGAITFDENDILLLYTDGVTEARDRQSGFFGERRLREALMRNATSGMDNLMKNLLNTLDVYTDCNLNDDVAMVALRFDEK